MIRALVSGDGGRDASNVYALLMTLHVGNAEATRAKNCHARLITIGRNWERKLNDNTIPQVTSFHRRDIKYEGEDGKCSELLFYRSSEEGCIPFSLPVGALEYEKGSFAQGLGDCSLQKIIEEEDGAGEKHVMVLGDVTEEVRLGVASAASWTTKGHT